MAELTIWRVFQLILLGMVIGLLIADFLFEKPAFDGWKSCIDNWKVTVDALNQCAVTCNFSISGSDRPESFGEVLMI
jgi:hypothetical protein